MKRKRGYRDRHTERYRSMFRRKGRPPTEGWLIAELADLTGVKARTIHYYLKLHLLAPPPFYGIKTRYKRNHLVRLLFIKRLREQEKLGLKAIKQRIDALSSADLEALVVAHIDSDALAAALGVPKTVSHALSAANAPSTSTTPDGWLLVPVSPTLQVLMRRDASPNDLWLIERLQQYCAAAAAFPPAGLPLKTG